MKTEPRGWLAFDSVDRHRRAFFVERESIEPGLMRAISENVNAPFTPLSVENWSAGVSLTDPPSLYSRSPRSIILKWRTFPVTRKVHRSIVVAAIRRSASATVAPRLVSVALIEPNRRAIRASDTVMNETATGSWYALLVRRDYGYREGSRRRCRR